MSGPDDGGVLVVKAVDCVLLCLGLATLWIASRSFVRNLQAPPAVPAPHRARKVD
jgi:hypothetical protein